MKSLALALLLLTAGSSFAQTAAAPAQTKEQKARHLIKVMNVGEVAVQGLESMIDSMRTSSPEVPAEYWDAFRKKININDFIELVIPIYMRNLEDADIDALIAFYESPAGKRYVAKQGVLMQESMVAGQTWGEKIAQLAIEEMSKPKQ